MIIEKKKVEDLKAADYNPRKDLKPGDAEYEKLNGVSKNLAMLSRLFGIKERG